MKEYERVSENIKRAIEKIGREVTIVTAAETKKGTAVIYPIRYEQNMSGGIILSDEGRTDPERYMMFADSRLLKGACYGDTVLDEKQQFTVLWVDEYECRVGNYMKACLRKRG